MRNNDNYNPIKVGERYFTSDEVTITDPCYDKGTWCTFEIKIKEGNYDCIAWEKEFHDTGFLSGKPYTFTRIIKCGIYLKDETDYTVNSFGSRNERSYVCNVGVDAGLCGFFQNKPNYNREEWSRFVDEMKDENGNFMRYKIIPEGFFTESGWGDGGYDVYAFKNANNEIIGLEIDFDDEDDEI